VIAVSKP
jgi:hypothetical protein